MPPQHQIKLNRRRNNAERQYGSILSLDAGILAPNKEEAKRFIEWGYTFVAVGSVLGMLAKNANALAKEFKGDFKN